VESAGPDPEQRDDLKGGREGGRESGREGERGDGGERAHAREHEDEGGVSRLLLSMTVQVLYATLIGLFLLNFNFFGIGKITSQYNQDLLNQIFGSWYPSQEQDQYVVVLMDDADLAGAGEFWPPHYEFWADAIESIMAYRPRGLMINTLFRDARDDPSIAELADVLSFYRAEGGAPIYLASVPGRPDGGLRPEIAPHVRLAPMPALADVADSMDAIERQYPLVVGSRHASEIAAPLRLYADLGRLEGRAPDGIPGVEIPVEIPDYTEAELRKTFSAPMEVVWGTTSPDLNRDWMNCRYRESPLGAILARIRGVEDNFRSDCPYAPTLPLAPIMRYPHHAGLAEAIGGKIVFLGTQISGQANLARLPAHQSSAHVFVQAMAYDNLLTFGSRYLRRPVQDDAAHVSVELIQILVLLFSGFLHNLFAKRHEFAALHGRELPWLDGMGFRLLVFAIVMAMNISVALVCIFVLNLAPLNWIGLLLFEGYLFSNLHGSQLRTFSRLGRRIAPSRRSRPVPGNEGKNKATA
jgi:CHASE2 domain-containing sensor protein